MLEGASSGSWILAVKLLFCLLSKNGFRVVLYRCGKVMLHHIGDSLTYYSSIVSFPYFRVWMPYGEKSSVKSSTSVSFPSLSKTLSLKRSTSTRRSCSCAGRVRWWCLGASSRTSLSLPSTHTTHRSRSSSDRRQSFYRPWWVIWELNYRIRMNKSTCPK